MKKNVRHAGKKIDKIIAGMIVGGAIASVVGATIYCKNKKPHETGEETTPEEKPEKLSYAKRLKKLLGKD